MTHKTVLGAATAAALTIVSLSAFTGTTTIPTVPATPVAAPATVALAPRDRAEPHPEIRKAIAALQKAKYDLQHAAHDFGGHRVDAIKSCDNAIAQLRLALQYDKN